MPCVALGTAFEQRGRNSLRAPISAIESMNSHDRKVVFSTGTDDWRTPPSLFESYHQEFRFTIDGAADSSNHLLPQWFGPGSPIAQDALVVSWGDERVWCNPPYSMCAQFLEKATLEKTNNGVSSCVLIPSRTDTRYFHNYVYDLENHDWYPWVTRVDFIKGRVKFINPSGPIRKPTPSVVEGRHAPNSGAPFPSMVVVF